MMANNRTPYVWILLILLILGLAARFAGLGNGLPDVVGPDEGFEIHRALKLGAGDFSFGRIGKGGFFYLLFVEYGAYFAWLRVTGEIASGSEFAERFAVDATPFWMIARVTHVVIAVLVILWTFLLGRRIFGVETGLIGAAIIAVSPLCVARSHYVGVDLPMTLLVLMTMLLLCDWSRPESKSRPIVTGIAFGAAVMTKIPAIVLLVPLAVANWLKLRGESVRRALLGREVLVAYLTAAVVFVAGQPGIVVKFGQFVRNQIGHTLFGIGPPGTSEVYLEAGKTANLWFFYLRSLADAMGLPFMLLAVAGVGVALHRRTRTDLVLLAFVLPFYVLISGARTTHLYYPRYVLPLLPLLAVLAGSVLWGVISSRLKTATARGLVTAALSLVFLLPSVVETSQWCASQMREDTRIVTRRWVEENVPAGSSVFLVGGPLSPSAPNLSLPLNNTDANVELLAAELRERGETVKAEFLEIRQKSLTRPRYDLHTTQHYEPVDSLEEQRRAGVRYFVLSRDHFDPQQLAKDTKHTARVLASRTALYEALNADPGVRRIFELDPRRDGLQGPGFEIYELREVAAAQ